MIDYKFKENIIVNDVMDYVNKTYDSHYAKTKNYQATEIIIDQKPRYRFLYGQYSKVCSEIRQERSRNKNDLMKVIHYAIIQLSQDHYQGNQPELKSPLIEKYNNS